MKPSGTRKFSKAINLLCLFFGAGILLYSIYYWPASHLGIPYLVVTLTAIIVSTRYTIPIPRGRGELSPAESFSFLAILLFGAEASVLFAALTAFCLPQTKNHGVRGQLLKSAVSIITTFLIVRTLSLTYAPLIGFVQISYSLPLLKAVATAVLVQSVLSTAVIVAGGAYRIKQAIWRTW